MYLSKLMTISGASGAIARLILDQVCIFTSLPLQPEWQIYSHELCFHVLRFIRVYNCCFSGTWAVVFLWQQLGHQLLYSVESSTALPLLTVAENRVRKSLLLPASQMLHQFSAGYHSPWWTFVVSYCLFLKIQSWTVPYFPNKSRLWPREHMQLCV